MGGDPHGAPGPQSHAGDLGNFTTDADGTASLDLVSADLGLDGDSSAVARTLVVHEGADDMTTQPSGAAGGRLACGSIHRAMKTPVAPAL